MIRRLLADEPVQPELFGNPKRLDYLPRGAWYGQFAGRGLDDELELKRGIKGVTGATLTARATTAAARRLLATHRVRSEIAKEKKKAERSRTNAAASPPLPAPAEGRR